MRSSVMAATIVAGVAAFAGAAFLGNALHAHRAPADCMATDNPRVRELAKQAMSANTAQAWRDVLAVDPGFASAHVRLVELQGIAAPDVDDFRAARAASAMLCERDRAYLDAVEPAMNGQPDEARRQLAGFAARYP